MPAIIDGWTHLDHGLDTDNLEAVREAAKECPDGAEVWIKTIKSPHEAPSAIHYHVPESEVFYARRGSRRNLSRLCARPQRMVFEVTIIAGMSQDGVTRVWTAYGGPHAPREPEDSYFVFSDAARKSSEYREAREFWSHAALSASAFDIEVPAGSVRT